MGVWTVSWLIFLTRLLLFDSGLLPWKQSALGLTTYQMLVFLATLTFIWGTHLFMKKPLHKWWIYGTISIAIVGTGLSLLDLALVYKLLLPILFASLACILIGLTFIRHFELQGIGHLITGYAFILWGIMTLTLPFVVNGSWFSPWGYSISGILRLVISAGTLIVYFEKNRMDLIKKETQYRLLAENAVDVIYHYQLLPQEKFEYISPSFLAVTGYTSAECYADTTLILKLIHPDDYSLFTNFISNMPHSIASPLTLRLVRKDKTILWVEQECVPIYDEKEQLVALGGIMRDITERKKLEQMASLFDQMNMVGSMAATVAHEIRNPMTTVRGYLQLIGRKQEYETDKDKFDLMIEERYRANDIIREYLSLSRRKIAILKKCSLNTIIEALFPLIQADANASKVYATLDLCPIPELLLDENEVRQLLLNLVRNSIEAMPTGGDLVISTASEEDKVVLSISDQGSGIPPHVLDHLGTPFITTKDTGTGLGLPICYQIAHRHNADIKIDTNSKGTTFFLSFGLAMS